MTNNKKTNDSVVIVTSGDTIDYNQYRDTPTYSSRLTVTSSSVFDAGINSSYVRAGNKVKVSTLNSRKQDKIEKINQRLNRLGELV